MPKYLKNSNKTWTATNDNKLVIFARKNTPTRVIGLLLRRSENAIRSRAHKLKISLKPTNQRPYNRRKLA